MPVLYGPQPGPQESFLESDSDIAIYGGAAGSGKTYAGVLSLGMGAHVPGYAAIGFRRTAPELTGGGSIWEETQAPYRAIGGEPFKTPNMHWRFPSGAEIELRHLQHEDDVYSHQGKQYAQVLFEELTHFTETQFWYMFSRVRSTCGVRPFMRATCNPDPDSFVRQLVDWWIDPDTGLAWNADGSPYRPVGSKRWFIRRDNGTLDWGDSPAEVAARHIGTSKVPRSLTFIPARLSDNPALTDADPDYESRLQSLTLTQRERLLGGNWNIRVSAGSLFRRQWFRVIDYHSTPVIKRVRGWDKAATTPSDETPDPDWTRGVRWALTERDELIIEDIASIRGTPHEVLSYIRRTAEADGVECKQVFWQDPAQAGVVDIDVTRKELLGYRVSSHRASLDKVTYAEVWSPQVERGRVLVMRAPWNEALFREGEAFPSKSKKVHDDIIDAASVGIMELGIRPNAALSTVDYSMNRKTGTQVQGSVSYAPARGPWTRRKSKGAW